MAGKVRFTAKRVADFVCPSDKTQAFIWDDSTPGLGLRATPAGKPAYIFQGRFQNSTLRLTIGSPSAWSITDAQAKAREYQRQIDEGKDPRGVKAGMVAADKARKEVEKLEAMTVLELWSHYLEDRRPHWSDNHYRDHVAMAQVGGEPLKRWQGKQSTTGPLVPLLSAKVGEVDADLLLKWASKEAQTRPSSTRLALRQFKAFWRWASEQKGVGAMVKTEATSSKRLQEVVGRQKAKQDNLQKDQLSAWFGYVRKIPNPVIANYLQCLLLTGARREELAALKWEDVNFQWHGMAFSDKVEDSRAVPLTPYVEHLIKGLPRRNEWIFSSETSETGRLINPAKAHGAACAAAGLSLSLHGLRRSFKSLTEWLDIPIGVVAQIMGHKPSATAEKHYTVRPLDLLRTHHERIEAWILEQAGIQFDPAAATGKRLYPVQAKKSGDLSGKGATTTAKAEGKRKRNPL